MAFARSDFLRYRPWLYHFTTPDNLYLLRTERSMLSATEWLNRANAYRKQVEDPADFLSRPRTEHRPLEIGPDLWVTLNDQRPLRNNANLKLEGTAAEFVRCLNGYVFFWPGTANEPKPKGKLARSFQSRYADFGCVRLPTAEVWTERGDIRFCRYNSGAPQFRDRITRGPQIFVKCNEAAFRVRHVAEVVFPREISLPRSAQWRPPSETQWLELF